MNSTLQKPPARSDRGQSDHHGRKRRPRKRPNRFKQFISVMILALFGAAAIWGGVLLGIHSRDAEFAPKQASKLLAEPAKQLSTATPMTRAWSDEPADIPNPQALVEVQRQRKNGVSFILIAGGVAGSRRSATRHGVGDFVKEAGATAGLNGTFFANASLNGTDNMLIGPSLCGDEAQVVTGPFDKRPALRGRPLVMMSPMRTKIVSYDPEGMDDDVALRYAMPEVSDAFLGGVWLVHDGAAADDDRIATFHVKDCNDFRRRAFFAIMPDGRPALGATNCSVSSRQLARALADSDIREAVLLDSGFSTSLVFGENVLVSGHSTPTVPSRPVPQAVLLFGNAATASLNEATPSTDVAEDGAPAPDPAPVHHRHRRHKRPS
ncbi:MAG TPA: phosphodiester glycosidase family protein [Capsulimonadaceae bacterium]|jgi:hypothetical protein